MGIVGFNIIIQDKIDPFIKNAKMRIKNRFLQSNFNHQFFSGRKVRKKHFG